MIYSKTSEYALRALQFLASKGPGVRLSISQVNRSTGVPRAYLAKIFRCLVRAGILSSKRGPEGGFALRRDPAQVRLMDVVRAVDEVSASPLTSCVMGLKECGTAHPCVLHGIWAGARERMLDFLEHRTLGEGIMSRRGHYSNRKKPAILSKRMRGVFH